LKVWDLGTGRALRTLEGHSGSVNGVAVTPDGRRAVSASDDKTLKVWDLDVGRLLRTLEGHDRGVSGVAAGVVDAGFPSFP
jgi:WD40 repeat protein